MAAVAAFEWPRVSFASEDNPSSKILTICTGHDRSKGDVRLQLFREGIDVKMVVLSVAKPRANDRESDPIETHLFSNEDVGSNFQISGRFLHQVRERYGYKSKSEYLAFGLMSLDLMNSITSRGKVANRAHSAYLFSGKPLGIDVELKCASKPSVESDAITPETFPMDSLRGEASSPL